MTNAPTNSNGETFEVWYAAANRACEGICGLTLDDLADGPSYDSWEADYTPEEYAVELLEDEGFPF